MEYPQQAAPTADRPENVADRGPGDGVESELIVYGAEWCGDCHRSRRFLERSNVPFRWIDVDENPDAVGVIMRLNRGHRSVPTIVFPDGSTLTEPSNAELARKLGLA